MMKTLTSQDCITNDCKRLFLNLTLWTPHSERQAGLAWPSIKQHSQMYQMFASNKIVPQQEPQLRASQRAHQYKPCHHREAVDQKGQGRPSPGALPVRTCPHIALKVAFVTKSPATIGRDQYHDQPRFANL